MNVLITFKILVTFLFSAKIGKSLKFGFCFNLKNLFRSILSHNVIKLRSKKKLYKHTHKEIVKVRDYRLD